MRMHLLLATCLVAMSTAFANDARHDSQVLLWPDGAPQADGSEDIDQPALTMHFPSEGKSNGTAIVVNPGGGYRHLASDYEGLQVARYLNRMGVTAFVLRYRLRPKYEPDVALLDAQRAIRFVRANADSLGVDPGRIGIMGFSAGGHLASAAGTIYDDGDADSTDPIERVSCRPDFLGLIYAVISNDLFSREVTGYRPTDGLVNSQTPPTFFVQTHEDSVVVPTHSLAFYQALLEAGVQAEMHVFGYGAHGLGLGIGDPEFAEWPGLFNGWLKRTKLLTDKERIEVSGSVTIDGKPLHGGWVTFHPKDPYAPSARAYINRSHGGKFTIDKLHGPTAGVHSIEVHEIAREVGVLKSGGYSVDDSRQYTSPSPDQKTMTRTLAPDKAVSITIETN